MAAAPKWKFINENENNITIESIEGLDMGQRVVVNKQNINKYTPVEGYFKPITQVENPNIENNSLDINKPSSGITYPSNSLLEKPIQGNNFTQRPFHNDDISNNTQGLHKEKDLNLSKNKNPHYKPFEPESIKGVPSIMNKFATVVFKGAYSSDEGLSSLIDRKGKRRWYEDSGFGAGSNFNDVGYSKDVTVSKLIEFGNSNSRETTPYYYSDFVYCKYFMKIPNNHLITLRRYSVPTFDSLDFPFYKNDIHVKENKITNIKTNNKNTDIEVVTDPSSNAQPDSGSKLPPVAQAVTWLGGETGNTLESLMSFTVGLNWKELKAQIHESTEQVGGAESLTGWRGMFAKSMSVIGGERGPDNIKHGGQTPPDPYSNGPYANRIYGPVNRIDAVMQRAAGFKFDHSIKLNFHYSARAISGINTKAAMLDIISNFLVLTYGVGEFWGGANRFRGSIQSYPWKKGMAALYSGDVVGFQKAITSSISTGGSNLLNMFEGLFKGGGGNFLDTLKNIGGKFAGAGLSSLMKTKAPMFHGLRSLLTGEPTGDWHLVIGNPLNPIMMIGNLICEDCKFTFNNEMGPDDFPTELKVEITLKHAMARDRHAIESMFNKGAGRIYTIPGEESWASNKESIVDTSQIGDKKVNKTGEQIFDDIIEESKKSYNVITSIGARTSANLIDGYEKTKA